MIPSDLKSLLAHPQTPWEISKELYKRLQPEGKRFKAAMLLPTDPESDFIHRCFMQSKPPGYSISKVTSIYNRSLHISFLAHLSNIEDETQKFLPGWNKEELAVERQGVIDRWKSLTQPFSPLTCTIEDEKETLHHAKVLPLWHGTKKARSICEGGFTYFGKQAYFAKGHGVGSTDIGYFGSGIYFTDSAHYANMHGDGWLLLSWVSMREPYPVVSDVPHPKKCKDMLTLEGKGAYQNYDAHFIPVASIKPHSRYCMEYYPCFQNQTPAWDEIVVFQKAQALPSFIVELAPDLVRTITLTYSFELCYAACQAGNLTQLEAWIAEDPQRLYTTDAQGENFLFAAILGNQLAILKWLYDKAPTLLKSYRKDGWSLMHAAAAEGQVEIISWLHALDPQMVHSQTITPLHLAAFYDQVEVIKLFVAEVKNNTTLVEELVQRPAPQTLLFLLEQGLDPNHCNKFKQSLLHLAAYKGQVVNMEILLEKGADINAQDLSKKTPLYLATAQGHLSAVRCLIDKKADPSILGIEGDTILHVATFYGYTPLLQELLLHCPQLIHNSDDDGKQPIHKAVWMNPKPDVVKLLIDYGANPNATNKFGYTPLHWAAKHGHIESAQLLIQAGAQLDAINHNQDLPFDLAIRWGQDAFVQHFLSTKPIPEIDPLPKDIENHYYQLLLKAKEDGEIEAQIFYLEKLSDIYVQKQNWLQAAKLLNGALAILEKNLDNPSFQKYLLARLERLEALFLESCKIKISPQNRGTLSSYRSILKNIRIQHVKKPLQISNNIKEVLVSLTNAYKKLLSTLILDAQKLLGHAPTDYACIGMGSMARGEMCPYSDLEFAFIIKEKTEVTLKYFRTLAQLIELKITNLGETSFPIFGRLYGEKDAKASPTPGGFSLDSGGNTPLGKPGYYELIDTPEGLAQFQSSEWMEADIIVTNALSSTCYIVGEERLVKAYHNAVTEKSKAKQKMTFLKQGAPFCGQLALKLLNGNIQEFKPELSKEKQETNAFGIKKELYRPLQSILGSLKLFYNLKSSSSFTIVQELLDKKIFSLEGAKNLFNALSQVLKLRFEAHTFYQNEEEFLLHLEENKPQDPRYLYLTEERLKPLHDIYKVLIPFHRSAEQFAINQNSKVLRVPFYDDSPLVQGAAFEKTLQYAQAHEAYQQAVSLNPNDIEAQLKLGSIEEKMGKSKEALARNLKALALAQQKYGENHPDVALSYNNIGTVYHRIGEYGKALEFYQKALKIQLSVLGDNHPDVATSYNNIGGVYDRLDDYDKALEFYQRALKIQLSVLGDNHPDVATSCNNIGFVYHRIGEYGKALEFYQKALKIRLSALGNNHSSVATSYNNIGGVCDKLSEYDKALEFYQKALKIRLSALGDNHPDVAASYNNIGFVYYSLKEYDKALEFYIKASKIWLSVLGDNHPNVATSYINIGAIFYRCTKYKKAFVIYQKALKIQLSVLGDNHSDVATSYNHIGLVYDRLGKSDKALEFYQRALKIQLSVLGDNHSSVATSYNNIGLVYDRLSEYDRALEFYQKALKVWFQAYEKNHPSIETGLKNLISCAKSASPASVRDLKEIYTFCSKILGENHYQVKQLAQLLE